MKCFRSSHACHTVTIQCVRFCSCLRKACSCTFQKLSYLLCGLSLSLSSLTLPQTVRLFNVSLRSQAPQQKYTVLSFDAKAWSRSQTDFSMVHYGITLWAYLSEPLVKDSHKRLSSTEKPRAPSYVMTRYRYVHVTERFRGIRKHCT